MRQLKRIFSRIAKSVALICSFLFGPLVNFIYAQDPPSDRINFDELNPLKIAGSTEDFSTPGKFISHALVYAFPIAGAILFVMLLWGGFEMVAGATETRSMEAGKQRITSALIGFILLFVAYWIAQLVQIVFGVQFLGA